MIDKIIAFSVRNKLLIGLMTIALIIGGLWAMRAVPLDAVPDITNNQVQVITVTPNLGTEDIEQFVTYPVEIALSNLPGVTEIRSVSRFGLSVVTVVFDDNMDTYLPRQLVSEKLNEIREEIPEGFGHPEMGPISTGLGEIYQYTLEVDPAYADRYSPEDLRTIQDWIVRRQMAMVQGVVEVNSVGGSIRQYEVAVNPDRLRAMDLTITDVYRALAMNNQNTGGAYIEKDHRANFIRGEGLARSLDDLRKIVVRTTGKVPVLIQDIAEVHFGRQVRYGALTKNGRGEAVGGIIMMLKDANSNDVIERVQARIGQIQQSLPEGVRIEPFLDRSELIASTTRTVRNNLLEGGLIVIFILVLLLGNWRGGLVVASTIPLSLLFAFIMMYLFDVWANLMSLGAIDFGIIVDGAVIIVESVVFTLTRRVGRQPDPGAAQRDAITRQSAGKMMNAAFFGQLIILIVFAPILALSGVEGKMFQPMALTFGFAMLGAMLLCLTYVPMISAVFIRLPKRRRRNWGDRIVHRLEEAFAPILRGALRHGALVVGGGLFLLAVAVFTFTRMGGEFIPQLDEGDLAFHAIMKPGTALSETIATTTRIEQRVKDHFPEVTQIVSRIGVADVPTDPMPMDIADIFVILKPVSEWTSADSKEELVGQMKDVLRDIPGVNYEFTQPIEMRFNELLTGVREDIAVKLFGEDLDILAEKAEEIGQLIADIAGIGDMRVEATAGLPQITVRYDRDQVARYGLTIADLNDFISTAFAGGRAGVIFEGEKRFDLVVRLDEAHRESIDDLRNLYVNLPDGVQIPLREVARISYQDGPMQISRDNTNRRTYVGINVRGRDVESLVKDIQDRLAAELELPPGYYIRYGGAFENLQQAKERLTLVVPLALVLIFILIFFALGSFRQAMMIYMAIPMAAIGGVFSLWLRGMPFSISAGVGFIVLFGVAVLNGLVLISSMNELEAEGVPLADRIMQGTRRRIRPILLTASTDILGFLPMAISTTAGAEVQRPLATVVIGGLLTSTLLTLIVIPVLYQWVERSRERNLHLPKPGMALLALLLLGLAPIHYASAQPADTLRLTLPEAEALARENAPELRQAALQLQQAGILEATALDLGNTILFTGGEEIRPGSAAAGTGIYTVLGIGQQNIDLLSTAARRAFLEEQRGSAQRQVAVREQDVLRKVRSTYYQALVARQRWLLSHRLSRVYNRFLEAAALRLEVAASSRLELLAARSRYQRIQVDLEHQHRDYLQALIGLQGALATERPVVLADEQADFSTAVPAMNDSLTDNSLLAYYRQQVKLQEAAVDLARTSLLPRFNAQAGWQRAGGAVDLLSFQVGISFPLWRQPEKARIEAAEVQTLVARQALRQREVQVGT
ncbi:MAG: CusA/CzcA family heavy metal efflux RND transporter, partial [Lewinella sp.]|nr:CusA/CzcA family heavy metal efflux RND transporter [Lewinella sp.]